MKTSVGIDVQMQVLKHRLLNNLFFFFAFSQKRVFLSKIKKKLSVSIINIKTDNFCPVPHLTLGQILIFVCYFNNDEDIIILFLTDLF